MKYELLKRTTVALFVSGVISTYSIAADEAEGVDPLEERVTELETAATQAGEQITNLINTTNENTKRVDSAHNDVEKVKGRVDTLETASTQAGEQITKLINTTNENTKRVEATSAQLEEVAKNVETTNNDVDAVKGRVDTLETASTQAGEQITKLINTTNENTKRVEATSAQLEEVAKNVEATNNDVDAVKAKADENSLAIAKIEKLKGYDDLTKVEKLVDSKADKAEVTTALSVKANQTDVNANKAEIAKKADKTELANKADKNNVYSKSDADQLFALKADNSVVNTQTVEINKLRTDVNAHTVDINKLRTDVNAHTKRLDHLDNRVNKLDKDLKRGLAAQAALTGLFQPYTVGKANFTAAVGGYKSQTAVAVGTGYRYNQNIATKAGVAFTQGGGVTYNAGVNFEW